MGRSMGNSWGICDGDGGMNHGDLMMEIDGK